MPVKEEEKGDAMQCALYIQDIFMMRYKIFSNNFTISKL
jgi:hypothetical protein